MVITLEISYFPLVENYHQPVDEFIGGLKNIDGIQIESGIMSSLITGPYDDVMNLIQSGMKPLMERYPSVFTLKISNSCAACSMDN